MAWVYFDDTPSVPDKEFTWEYTEFSPWGPQKPGEYYYVGDVFPNRYVITVSSTVPKDPQRKAIR